MILMVLFTAAALLWTRRRWKLARKLYLEAVTAQEEFQRSKASLENEYKKAAQASISEQKADLESRELALEHEIERQVEVRVGSIESDMRKYRKRWRSWTDLPEGWSIKGYGNGDTIWVCLCGSNMAIQKAFNAGPILLTVARVDGLVLSAAISSFEDWNSFYQEIQGELRRCEVNKAFTIEVRRLTQGPPPTWT